jgi:hypothetical protein
MWISDILIRLGRHHEILVDEIRDQQPEHRSGRESAIRRTSASVATIQSDRSALPPEAGWVSIDCGTRRAYS